MTVEYPGVVAITMMIGVMIAMQIAGISDTSVIYAVGIVGSIVIPSLLWLYSPLPNNSRGEGMAGSWGFDEK